MNSPTPPSLMAQALGEDWWRLHPTLRAHHSAGTLNEIGAMDVEFPRFMSPILWLLRGVGALVHRAQPLVHTQVHRHMVGNNLQWHRTLTYADSQVLQFNSTWVLENDGRLLEYVNPWLGLEMAPKVLGQRLQVQGVRLHIRLGRWRLALSERWLLGHTLIDEYAIDDRHYAMDFRLVHPWFGQVFRYAGRFQVDPSAGNQSVAHVDH